MFWPAGSWWRKSSTSLKTQIVFSWWPAPKTLVVSDYLRTSSYTAVSYFGDGRGDTDTSKQITSTVPCDKSSDVLHHLTLASCWLSSSIRALASQCLACSGLCILAWLPPNRWADRSLGEGSRETKSGDRWLTILLRAGRLWDNLGKKPMRQGWMNLMTLLYINTLGKYANVKRVQQYIYIYVFIPIQFPYSTEKIREELSLNIFHTINKPKIKDLSLKSIHTTAVYTKETFLTYFVIHTVPIDLMVETTIQS